MRSRLMQVYGSQIAGNTFDIMDRKPHLFHFSLLQAFADFHNRILKTRPEILKKLQIQFSVLKNPGNTLRKIQSRQLIRPRFFLSRGLLNGILRPFGFSLSKFDLFF